MSGKLGNIYVYLCPMKPNKNRNTSFLPLSCICEIPVMGSIPSGVVALLRGVQPLSPVSPNLGDIFVGRLCFASP